MKHPFLSRALCCGLAALVLIGLLIPLAGCVLGRIP